MRPGKNLIKATIFSRFMLVLVLDPQCSLNAALEGIDLCLKTVIPGMFPLLFLSSLLAGELYNNSVPFIEHLLRIPKGTAGFFLVGLVCGYPVGAKLLQNEIDRKNMDAENATRMITFCNNASPAFIIGILAPIFGNVCYAIILWLIQISSSIIIGVLLPDRKPKILDQNPIRNKNPATIMTETIKALTTVCGWIIIFGILLAYLKAPILNHLSSVPRTILCGILELTNGMYALQHIYAPFIRFVLASVLLSIGGLCILLQTKSVAPSINIRKYIYGRLLHASITATLASILGIVLFPSDTVGAYCVPLIFTIFIFSLLILFFNKKR